MPDKYEYDIALSFAGEQRNFVREVAKILDDNYKLKVFFDEFEESKLWGKNLYDYLYEIYSKKAKYVIIFVSKEYKEKIWTNHERQASQERALTEKNEYILPVKFDDTIIPGLKSTIGYLDAKKYSPYKIAVLFAEKFGLNEKDRWFGIWEREQHSQAVSGLLNIYNVQNDGFYFDLTVIHGSHMGDFENEFANFIDKNKALFTTKFDDEICKIEFIKLNDTIILQETDCQSFHGMRAYFDGKYNLKKDFFYHLDEIKFNDNLLSKIYSQLGNCYEEFLNCFSDYWIEEKNNKKIIFGKVPGMYPYYNAILIIDNKEIRGSFVNVNLNKSESDKVIYWFATDDKIDNVITDWNIEESQFQEYTFKRIKFNQCQEQIDIDEL